MTIRLRINLVVTGVIIVLALGVTLTLLIKYGQLPPVGQPTWWQIQSVDTVKQSRDLSQEMLNEPDYDVVIRDQLSGIARTGATHVAIGTPYDEEFFPYLERWVKAARDAKLNVWFRGNQAGWEGWFDYPEISTGQHLAATDKFIRAHADLFVNGDLFDPCPECENGALGDPRQTGELEAYRSFLAESYRLSANAFSELGKSVMTLFSMNFDVASLVMDHDTTQALGGVVTIDHYVADPAKLVTDIEAMAQTSGGLILLGEFGAPIPDIHGRWTAGKQNEWLAEVLPRLTQKPQLIGLNYWVGFGGTTALWNEENKPSPAVATLTSFFQPDYLSGQVGNRLFGRIGHARVSLAETTVNTTAGGYFQIPFLPDEPLLLTIHADGYKEEQLLVEDPTGFVTVRMKRK